MEIYTRWKRPKKKIITMVHGNKTEKSYISLKQQVKMFQECGRRLDESRKRLAYDGYGEEEVMKNGIKLTRSQGFDTVDIDNTLEALVDEDRRSKATKKTVKGKTDTLQETVKDSGDDETESKKLQPDDESTKKTDK